MSFVAGQYSPYFQRSLEAWRRRNVPGFDAERRLADSVTRPLTRETIANWIRELSGAAPDAPMTEAAAGEALASGLRRARALVMLTLIERDVTGRADLEEVCAAMTWLAELATTAALRCAARELVERFGEPCDGDGQVQDLLAIGMGKTGGYELNVSSDLDLVFVFADEGETRGRPDEQGRVAAASRIASSDFMTRLARRVLNLLAEPTADGFVFRVDTRLRPNGDSGPLVCSLPMLEHYFFVQGREWERLAWLKGRMIGDTGIAPAQLAGHLSYLTSIVTPFVFRRYLDFAAFAALRQLHAMIQTQVGKRDARHEGSYDVKLGRGGIREIEFIAQLFQIVRGGRDADLRDKRTLVTLARLGERRLLPADDVATLSQAYRLLRRTEHALQYQEDAQTHRLPAAPAERERVAAMLDMPAAQFETTLAQLTGAVQQIFDALLHGVSHPNGGAAPDTGRDTGQDTGQDTVDGAGQDAEQPTAHGARQPTLPDPGQGTGTDIGPHARPAIAREASAPASDPSPQDAAGWEAGLSDEVRHRIAALRAGTRYRGARAETRDAIDQLLQTPEVGQAGELGMLRLIDLLETVSGRGGYVALLLHYPQARARVVRMLGRAKWAAEYLRSHPIVLDELLDGQLLQPVDYAVWTEQVGQALAAAELDGVPDQERQMDILREAHHAQVFRLLAQDLEGRLPLETLSDLLSELADRVLAIVIPLVWSQSRLRFRDTPRFAAIAYGKLGGKELGYASDLDLVFLYEDDDERAPEAYAALAQRVAGWLATRTAAGLLFEIDLRLRPNGNAGLLVSSLRSFENYQRESAWVWEHQALTRARFAAGDAALGERFEQLRRDLLSQPREPAKLTADVLAMRRKMLDGHPNRTPLFDLKHDRGGMVDIEFIVQFLVLAHGHALPQLLDNKGNIALLSRAAAAGLIEPGLAERVASAYRKYRQLQHLMRLNDHPFARIEPGTVATEREAVLALWAELLGRAP